MTAVLSSARVGHRALLSPATRIFFRSREFSVATRSAMEKVTFGKDLPGYEIGSKDAPGLVLLQEWWGVTDNVKELATKFNSKGYRVLIPDLYKGKIGVDAEEASHLMNNLDFKAAIEEMTQAVKYLKSTGSPKVGALGFCMGGALTFCAAQHSGVDAAVPFYGTPNPAVCQVDAITIPVQAHFGQEDKLAGFSDPEAASKVEQSMQAAGGDIELLTYPGCGHAFMNAITHWGKEKLKETFGPQPEEQALLAFERAVAFLDKHLK